MMQHETTPETIIADMIRDQLSMTSARPGMMRAFLMDSKMPLRPAGDLIK